MKSKKLSKYYIDGQWIPVAERRITNGILDAMCDIIWYVIVFAIGLGLGYWWRVYHG